MEIKPLGGQYEVEIKYQVTDLSLMESILLANNGEMADTVLQVDTYYAHPMRDFASTDEALRIREAGNDISVTYKGPKIDSATKTRLEIDIPIATGNQAKADCMSLMKALGFQVVAEVRKTRRSFSLDFHGAKIKGALDEVELLGSFIELEIMAPEDEIDVAKTVILDVAKQLKLLNPERRSYLELLLISGPTQILKPLISPKL